VHIISAPELLKETVTSWQLWAVSTNCLKTKYQTIINSSKCSLYMVPDIHFQYCNKMTCPKLTQHISCYFHNSWTLIPLCTTIFNPMTVTNPGDQNIQIIPHVCWKMAEHRACKICCWPYWCHWVGETRVTDWNTVGKASLYSVWQSKG
jgi:hypothetical protein